MNTYQAGQKLLCGDYTAYTPTGMSLFAKAGRLYKTPLRGDVVYFYHASMRRVAHVGLVKRATRSIFGVWDMVTEEGNTAPGRRFSRDGGSVAEKHYTFREDEVGGTHLIAGFGRPMYGADTCTADEMIAAIEAEDGYVEKASAAQLETKSGNPGDKNFTKYAGWYGLQGSPWCQMLISWCAYTACAAHRAKAHTGWQQTASGWMYTDETGRRLAGEWAHIGGRWYVFDNAGMLIRDAWFRDAAGWYYLAGDGGMLSGQWLEYQGAQYYLTKTGLMARSTYVRGTQPSVGGAPYYYYVDAEGRWDSTRDTETLPAGAEAVA